MNRSLLSLPSLTRVITMAPETLMAPLPLPRHPLLSKPSLTEQESKKTGKSTNCISLHSAFELYPNCMYSSGLGLYLAGTSLGDANCYSWVRLQFWVQGGVSYLRVKISLGCGVWAI
jgi:hypothetical protein